MLALQRVGRSQQHHVVAQPGVHQQGGVRLRALDETQFSDFSVGPAPPVQLLLKMRGSGP